MYLCKVCGNKRYFLENNCIETYVSLDPATGELVGTSDKFLGCSEVVCDKCKASSEDGDILDRNTMKPIAT